MASVARMSSEAKSFIAGLYRRTAGKDLRIFFRRRSTINRTKVRDARIMIAGRRSVESGPKTETSILGASLTEMSRYTVFIEPTATGYSAPVPELPGCVAAASTLDETRQFI